MTDEMEEIESAAAGDIVAMFGIDCPVPSATSQELIKRYQDRQRGQKDGAECSSEVRYLLRLLRICPRVLVCCRRAACCAFCEFVTEFWSAVGIRTESVSLRSSTRCKRTAHNFAFGDARRFTRDRDRIC
jgi:hypothetical protein